MKQINSIAELMRELKTNKENVHFETITHEFRPELIGEVRTPGKDGTVQTNAFTIKTNRPDGTVVDSWLWTNDVTLKDGIMKYKTVDIAYKVYTK